MDGVTRAVRPHPSSSSDATATGKVTGIKSGCASRYLPPTGLRCLREGASPNAPMPRQAYWGGCGSARKKVLDEKRLIYAATDLMV